MSIHPTSELISRYAVGAAGVDDATVWALEAHLESCPACRELLDGAIDPGTRGLLHRVAGRVDIGIAAGPDPVRRRWARHITVAARFLPWLATVAGLMLVAVASEEIFRSLPSLVLLVAPVAPLLPVAAAWSRRTDPAWELLASTPRVGLWLLLRRTLAVLAAVIPILGVAGWVTGHPAALWLLPCLAFTAGSLALGGLTGVDRAGLVLVTGWSAAVVVPSLATARLPGVLRSGSWPGWVVLTVLLLAVIGLRSADHRRYGGTRG